MLRSPPRGYWALAPVLNTLRRDLLQAYPLVPASLYWTIGDADHQARHSDHNPDQYGYVRALDIPNVEHSGPPLELLALLLQEVGASGSHRLNPGGYVIWNRRIASGLEHWRWRPYRGKDPHTHHLHVSCSLLPPLYAIERPWHIVSGLALVRAGLKA